MRTNTSVSTTPAPRMGRPRQVHPTFVAVRQALRGMSPVSHLPHDYSQTV
jgi:hypothetical protein